MGAVQKKPTSDVQKDDLPSRFGAAVNALEALRIDAMAEIAALHGVVEEERDRATEAEIDKDEAEREAAALRRRAPEIEAHIGELARIRTCLKDGRCDEGRARLDRVLDDLDGAWRTRA